MFGGSGMVMNWEGSCYDLAFGSNWEGGSKD